MPDGSLTTLNQLSKLFQPIKLGRNMTLAHRVVMAPLTRNRADADHVHTDLGVEYYTQRSSTLGTFIISEATFVAKKAGGYPSVPAMETDEQVAAWKKITDAVHAKGGFIFAQLAAIGRQALPAIAKKEGFEIVGPSEIPLKAREDVPRALTIDEIHEYTQLFATAAANAVHRAGFDGVELHGGTGYLIDQFIQDVSNQRTDEYGGSIENRARFVLELLDAVSEAVGEDRTAVRLSPWSTHGDMRMEDPKPQFSYIVEQIKKRHPNFAYLHLIEPRVTGNVDRSVQEGESNDFLRAIWSPRPFLTAGGYTRASAFEQAEKGDIVVFGRHFIANPDLPIRLQYDLPLNSYDRSTFYKILSPDGYVDYPFSAEAAELAERK